MSFVRSLWTVDEGRTKGAPCAREIGTQMGFRCRPRGKTTAKEPAQPLIQSNTSPHRSLWLFTTTTMISLWIRILTSYCGLGEDQSPFNAIQHGVSSLKMFIQSQRLPGHAGSINTYFMQANKEKRNSFSIEDVVSTS